jgi:hypothetical protein
VEVKNPIPRFHFAISYAGPQASRARRIANELRKKGHSQIFLSEDYEHETLGSRGDKLLYEIYRHQSKYCIALISKDYDDPSRMTRYEKEAMLARMQEDDDEFFLPVRVDDYKPAWLDVSLIFFDLRERTLDDLIEKLDKRYKQSRPISDRTTINDLNKMLGSDSLQERVDTMEEVGLGRKYNYRTIELLELEIYRDTRGLQGQLLSDVQYVRQCALWTLGILHEANNQSLTDDIVGLESISRVINDASESPEIKIAAVQAIQVMNRQNDRRLKQLLTTASRDRNPNVRDQARRALAGERIPLPSS